MKRLAVLTAVILATATSFVLAWLLWDVFVLFFVSVALAAALRPYILQMRTWKLSDGSAILICYVALMAFIGGMFLIYSSLVGSEIATMLNGFPAWYDGLRQRMLTGAVWQQTAVEYLPSSDMLIRSLADTDSNGGGNTLLALSASLLNSFIFLVGAMSLGYYWLVDQSHFERLWLSLLPVPTRVRARSIWRDAEFEISTYIRVELGIVITIALVLLGIYTLIGLPFAGLLSLANALAQLLPWLGGSLMLIVTLGVALSTGDITMALIVLATGIVQELLLGYVVRPQLYRNAKRLNSLLVVVMLLALASLGGWLTALLAQPLAVLIQVVYQNTVLDTNRLVRTDALPELDRLSERAAELEESIGEQEEARPELRSIVQRVRSLMSRARTVVTVND